MLNFSKGERFRYVGGGKDIPTKGTTKGNVYTVDYILDHREAWRSEEELYIGFYDDNQILTDVYFYECEKLPTLPEELFIL